MFFCVLELSARGKDLALANSVRLQAWLDPGGKAKLLELSEELCLSLQRELADYRCK